MERIECVNPNTGGKMNIDKEVYDLIVKAIKDSLKGNKVLTYTQLVEGINKYLTLHKINFPKSVGWYAVTVKNDMEYKKLLTVYTEKGKKLHRLS